MSKSYPQTEFLGFGITVQHITTCSLQSIFVHLKLECLLASIFQIDLGSGLIIRPVQIILQIKMNYWEERD